MRKLSTEVLKFTLVVEQIETANDRLVLMETRLHKFKKMKSSRLTIRTSELDFGNYTVYSDGAKTLYRIETTHKGFVLKGECEPICEFVDKSEYKIKLLNHIDTVLCLYESEIVECNILLGRLWRQHDELIKTIK